MPSPYDPLLTLDEAGDLLGTGPDLPARLVADGRLDHIRDGDDLRIPESALIAYLTETERRQAATPARPIRQHSDRAEHPDRSAAGPAAPAA